MGRYRKKKPVVTTENSSSWGWFVGVIVLLLLAASSVYYFCVREGSTLPSNPFLDAFRRGDNATIYRIIQDETGRLPDSAGIASTSGEIGSLIGWPTKPISEEKFEEAVMSGNWSIIKPALKQGFSVNARVRGLTPLMWAARQGKVDAVKGLLVEKADPFAFSEKGYTALMYAVCNRDTECVKALLTESSWLPWLNDKKRRDCGLELHHASTGLTAIHYACIVDRDGSRDILRLLLEHEADVDARSNFDGYSPLMVAAHVGMSALKDIYEKGSDREVREADAHGDTALDHAELTQQVAAISFLKGKQGPSPWNRHLLYALGILMSISILCCKNQLLELFIKKK